MWVLFVLSIVGKEAKVTFYDNYNTQEKCMVVEQKLKKEFTEGEDSMCYYVEYLMPKQPKISK